MYKWSGGLALLAACATGSKGYAPGDQHATVSPKDSVPGSTTAAAATADAANAKLPPYPTAPADPWRGVVGDQPRRWSEDRAHHWMLRGDATDCSAAHDHCIDPDAWFVAKTDAPGPVTWSVLGPDGKPATAANGKHVDVGDAFSAFRTVPASKTNIVKGAAVIVLDGTVTSGVASHDAAWTYGVVGELDLDGGTFTFQNDDTRRPLANARVVVLTWQPGDKVKIVGGKQRNELGVKASETYGSP